MKPVSKAFTPDHGRQFLLGLAAYVGGFFLLRMLVSSTVGVDDVEQMIYAQDWRLGYNPSQPPLYTWLTLLVFKLVGVSPVAPQLLRYTILFLTYFFLYQCARRVIRDPGFAVTAACSPVLIYSVGWGAHQGFTHSALVGATTGATLVAFMRVIENGSIGAYATLGLAMGLGLQSKYNFAILALAMIAAAAWQPQTRTRVITPRMLISVAIALAIIAPSLWWLLRGFDLGDVFGGYVNYQRADSGTDSDTSRWPALFSVVRSSLAFIASFLVVAVLLFPQVFRALPAADRATATDYGGLLGRFFVIVYAVLGVGVVAGVLEHVKIRWMYPVLILFPLYFFYRVERIGYSRGQLLWLRRIITGFVILTAVLWALQPYSKQLLCGRCRLFEPYPQLAEGIAASGFRKGTLLAEDEHIAGNLRSQFPEARTLSLRYPFYVPPLTNGASCLVIWNTRNGETVPAPLADFAQAQTGYRTSGDEPVHFVEGHNRANGRALRLGYIMVANCLPQPP